MHELQQNLERQVRKLARGVLGQPQRAALDRSAEAVLSVRLRGHERMFPCARECCELVRRQDLIYRLACRVTAPPAANAFGTGVLYTGRVGHPAL
jgi:hypothetical protein